MDRGKSDQEVARLAHLHRFAGEPVALCPDPDVHRDRDRVPVRASMTPKPLGPALPARDVRIAGFETGHNATGSSQGGSPSRLDGVAPPDR